MSEQLPALLELDRALDELAAGGEVPPAGVAGDAFTLAVLAVELRATVPAPPAGAAARGRAAFLAAAAPAHPAARPGQAARVRTGRAGLAAVVPRGFGGPAAGARGMLAAAAGRRRLLRVAVLAAALLLLVAVPAAMARRALPGTPLWPLRQAGQQVRLALAGDAVDRASLQLNRAELLLRAAAGAGRSDREDLVAKARAQVQAALDSLDARGGPEAVARRARADRLLAALAALEREDGNRGPGGDRSGPGGGGGGDRSGPGGGSGSSGSGSSGSGSGSSGSGSSGSGSSGSGSSGSESSGSGSSDPGTRSPGSRTGSSLSSGSGSGDA
jgi:hypothetical protein